MSKRSANDFRNKAEQVGVGQLLSDHVWYRSPLWTHDHYVGEDSKFYDEDLAWCGRALGVARDWENEDYGGLWVSNRTADTARCNMCERKQSEWDELMQNG